MISTSYRHIGLFSIFLLRLNQAYVTMIGANGHSGRCPKELPTDALAGDTARAATSGEVKDLRRETSALKEVVADLTLENRLLKKSMSGDGEDEA